MMIFGASLLGHGPIASVAGRVDLSMETHNQCCCVVVVSGRKRLPAIVRVIRDPHLRSQGIQTLKLTVGRGQERRKGAKILPA